MPREDVAYGGTERTYNPPRPVGGAGGTGGVTGDTGVTEEVAGPYSMGGQTQDKPEYGTNPGGYFDDEFGVQVNWAEYVADRLLDEVPKAARSFGENPDDYRFWVEGQLSTLLTAVDAEIKNAPYSLPPNYLSTIGGMQFAYNLAVKNLSTADLRLRDALGYWRVRPGESGSGVRGRGGGGGGGGGARRPTADEIRAQFDVDQLAADAREIWRGTLLDEPTDARGMAKAYVEAIVANPEQKLDFQTFIEKRAEGTARYASLFRNKPPGLTTQQYLAPYLSTAQQMARPKEAVNIAAGGAQLGADPNAFRARLQRTNAATTSAPFISSMEQRLSGLRRVLKG